MKKIRTGHQGTTDYQKAIKYLARIAHLGIIRYHPAGIVHQRTTGYQAICILTIALLTVTPFQSLAAPAAPPDYDAEKMARLQDNVMTYEELGDLVAEYNPTVQSQVTASYNSSIQQLKDMEDTFKKNANTYDKWMKDLREEHGFSDAQANQVLNLSQKVAKKQATEEELGKAMVENGIDPSVWGSYTTYYTVKATFQGTANAYHDVVEKNERIMTTADMDAAIDQITAGTQQLMNQYNQLLSQKELVDKNKELNEAMYQLKTTQLQAGMATQNDVLAAQKDLLVAESSVIQVENGINTVRQTLCMMTGWSWDAQPEIQGIPAPDFNRINNMNPEEDAVLAMNSNYTVRKTRHSKPKGDNGTRTSFFRTVDETEQKAAAKLKDLYSAVQEKKAAYEAAQTAYEAAELDRGKADRQRQAGLLSDLQYLGTQVSYLQKKSARETAEMALFQAMEDYDWAMDGVASLN